MYVFDLFGLMGDCFEGLCTRSGCRQRRAVNQLTGQVLDYCSIECMRLVDRAGVTTEYQHDENGYYCHLNH